MWSFLTALISNPIATHLLAAGAGALGGSLASIKAATTAIKTKGEADLAVAKAALEKDWAGVKTAAAALGADIEKRL